MNKASINPLFIVVILNTVSVAEFWGFARLKLTSGRGVFWL